MPAGRSAFDPKPKLSSRVDGHARAMKDSVLRAQGRFGALHHPPPSLACRPAHKQEVADDRDRQLGLHRCRQRRYRDMPASRAYSDCAAALTARGRCGLSVTFRGELGQDDVKLPKIEAAGARIEQVQSISLGPSAVMITLPG